MKQNEIEPGAGPERTKQNRQADGRIVSVRRFLSTQARSLNELYVTRHSRAAQRTRDTGHCTATPHTQAPLTQTHALRLSLSPETCYSGLRLLS